MYSSLGKYSGWLRQYVWRGTFVSQLSRRTVLGIACTCWAAESDRVVDIHQHTVYGDRGAEGLVVHQRAMGVSKTVVLPVGTRAGLTPGAGGNQSALDLA